MAEGRIAEAAALARTGEQVLTFLNRLPEPEEDPDDVQAEREEWVKAVWSTAVRLAEELLKDGHVPAVHTRAAFRWRADNLGPAVAAADRARAQAGGWAAGVYDEHGVLRAPQTFAAFCAGFRS